MKSNVVIKICNFTTKYFTLWVVLFSLASFFYSTPFLIFTPHLNLLLGITMLCMGMTLKLEDFKTNLAKPSSITIGVLAQYIIMPLLGYLVASFLMKNPEKASGFVLLGSCPGGVASNVLVYLGKGNVALSVILTSVTTLISPVVLPVLMLVLANKWVRVDPLNLFFSTVQIIILPVIIGTLLGKYFPKFVQRSKDYTPAISVFALLAIITSMIAANIQELMRCGLIIFFGVLVHNTFGLLFGYLIPLLLGQDEGARRAITIEVGIQNAGLGAALSYAYFTPLTALPSVIYAIWALITGSVLANFWGKRKQLSQ